MFETLPRGLRGGAAGLLLLFCLDRPAGAAGLSGDDLWLNVSAARAAGLEGDPAPAVPAGGRRLELHLARLQELLAAAPREVLIPRGPDGVLRTREQAGGEVVVPLPLPDGSFRRFRVEESPIVAEDAEDPCGDVKTYRGVAVDAPAVTTRFDLSPSGLHALILQDGQVAFVEPAGDPTRYVSFTASGGDLRCGTSEGAGRATEPLPSLRALQGAPGEVIVLRLAVAMSGEITQAVDGRANACQLRKALVNQVSALLESEVAVRLELVADGGSLLFDDPATDPYPSQAITSCLLAQNQKTLDETLGKRGQGYDVGHLLVSSDGAGITGRGELESACDAQRKGMGASNLDSVNLSDLTNLAGAVMVMTHEIGHQLGAHHTFNCRELGGLGRTDDSAYEPGYGSTLMSYGNMRCDGFSLGWDPYFHVTSLLRIRAHVLACSPGTSQEGSQIASLDVQAAFKQITIPRKTPFVLAASGNAASYTWEEVDLPPADPEQEYPFNRPLFRSFPPSTLPLRTFPPLENLLLGRATPGEELPITERTMTFIVTGRDGHGGLGGAVTEVTVKDGVVGPFQVTSPDATKTWRPGPGKVAVEWDVAGTNGAFLQCPEVSLFFYSSDGRQLATLAPRVPNSGRAEVDVPDLALRLAGHAHVLVFCLSSPFFAASPGFTYEPRGGQEIADVPPVAAFEYQTGSLLQTVAFDASPSFDLDGVIDRIEWSFGDGYSGDKRKFVHGYQAAGRYTVTLTVRSGGVSSTVSKVVLVPPKPAPSGGKRELGDPRAVIDADLWRGRAPVTVHFKAGTDPDHPIVRFSWEIQDPVQPETVEGETASHTFTAPGDNFVVLTVWDEEGRSGRAVVPVHVDFPPEAGFSVSPSGPLTLAFDASSSRDAEEGLVRFSWDFGDIHGGEGARVLHTFPSPGTYRVRLRVWDELGATANAEKDVTVSANRPPVAALTIDPASGPVGLTATLDGSASYDPDGRIVHYHWSFDGSPVPELDQAVTRGSFLEGGRQTVQLVVEDDQGAFSQPAEASVYVGESCESWRQRHAAWEVACNDNTAVGYYWKPGPEVKEYGWYGNVPGGGMPECDAANLGATGMTSGWKAAPTWTPVYTVWCRNTPASDNLGCAQPDGPIFFCPDAHCGIYQVTCEKQFWSGPAAQ